MPSNFNSVVPANCSKYTSNTAREIAPLVATNFRHSGVMFANARAVREATAGERDLSSAPSSRATSSCVVSRASPRSGALLLGTNLVFLGVSAGPLAFTEGTSLTLMKAESCACSSSPPSPSSFVSFSSPSLLRSTHARITPIPTLSLYDSSRALVTASIHRVTPPLRFTSSVKFAKPIRSSMNCFARSIRSAATEVGAEGGRRASSQLTRRSTACSTKLPDPSATYSLQRPATAPRTTPSSRPSGAHSISASRK
mmetsp:Transcript_8124/g.18546  ORF Transcript_8124/g.18546 Transcript_8124/m.18546 type:complete len:255 (-) Transcript_8124:998-1762(-)